jgi:hypothetical protein
MPAGAKREASNSTPREQKTGTIGACFWRARGRPKSSMTFQSACCPEPFVKAGSTVQKSS